MIAREGVAVEESGRAGRPAEDAERLRCVGSGERRSWKRMSSSKGLASQRIRLQGTSIHP
jgi:hypothetical protein